MIEVRGLTKRYGETTAVSGLSFDVMPGKVTGFLGPNGAGKTTTMRLVYYYYYYYYYYYSTALCWRRPG